MQEGGPERMAPALLLEGAVLLRLLSLTALPSLWVRNGTKRASRPAPQTNWGLVADREEPLLLLQPRDPRSLIEAVACLVLGEGGHHRLVGSPTLQGVVGVEFRPVLARVVADSGTHLGGRSLLEEFEGLAVYG